MSRKFVVPKKRFLVFAWYDYEAYGGFDDLRNSFDTYKEASEYASDITNMEEWGYEQVQIIDRKTMDLAIYTVNPQLKPEQ